MCCLWRALSRVLCPACARAQELFIHIYKYKQGFLVDYAEAEARGSRLWQQVVCSRASRTQY